MKVIITSIADGELNEIWKWNANERGIHHADNYVEFLKKSISALGKTYAKGKAVGTRPDLRYLLIQRRTGGHGHIAVYSVDANKITVAHVFHTAQDWQTSMAEDAE